MIGPAFLCAAGAERRPSLHGKATLAVDGMFFRKFMFDILRNVYDRMQ
jgi:hypothetical protein